MARREIDLQFPAGGVNRRFAYQSQPPYSCVDALNVRAYETIQGRQRGGSRPGTGKAFQTQLGSGNPIRLLSVLRSLNQSGAASWSDDFETAGIDANWVTGIAGFGNVWTESGGFAQGTTDGVYAGGVRIAPTPAASMTQGQRVEVEISNLAVAFNTEYSLFARLDDTTPAVADGVQLECIFRPGNQVDIKLFVNAAVVAVYTFTSFVNDNLWLVLEIDANNLIRGYFRDLVIPAVTYQATAGSATKTRVGFRMSSNAAGEPPKLAIFRWAYSVGGSAPASVGATASANGIFYYESLDGTMTASIPVNAIRADDYVMAADRRGVLYIADHHKVANGTDGTTTGTILTSALYPLWSVVLSNTATDPNYWGRFLVEISAGAGATVGYYSITAMSGADLTLGTAPGNGSSRTFRIVRTPKKFDSANVAAGVVQWTATAGVVPVGCTILTRWSDRIVLTGDPDNPHVWYMSRRGDPDDWNFGASVVDVGRALAGTSSFLGTATTTAAGSVGFPITAAMSLTDDVFLLCSNYTMARIVGDPAYGGRVDTIDTAGIGVVSRTAWCKGPNGEVLFLSRDGLYAMAPEASSMPQSISREVLPQDIVDRLNPALYFIQLAYDVRDRGVHILLTPKTAGAITHWWFDWTTKGFWPVTYPSAFDPMAVTYYPASDPANECVLLGGRDGYLRKHGSAFTSDDGTNFISYVFYGPFRLGSGVIEGILHEIHATLGANSGGLTWEVFTGDDPESAFNSAAVASGVFVAGRNFTVRPRRRDQSAYLKLSSTGGSKWAIESMAAVIEAAGVLRKG